MASLPALAEDTPADQAAKPAADAVAEPADAAEAPVAKEAAAKEAAAREPVAEEEENAPPTKRKSKSDEPAAAGKPNLAKLAAEWDDE